MKAKLMYLGIAVLACIGLSGCGNKVSINLNDYTQDLTLSGLDGNGNASVSLDYAKLESFLDEGELEDIGAIILVEDACKVSVSPDAGLKNGDTVTVSYTIDEETLKEAKIKVTGKSYEVIISDLNEGTEISYFPEDLKVTFSGTSPQVSATMECESYANKTCPQYSAAISYQFEGDDYMHLAKGDTVTVVAKANQIVAESAGYILSGEDKKTFTVENVPFLLIDVAELTEEQLNDLEKVAYDQIINPLIAKDANIINTWYMYYTLEENSIPSGTKHYDGMSNFQKQEVFSIYNPNFSYTMDNVQRWESLVFTFSFDATNQMYAYGYGLTGAPNSYRDAPESYISIRFPDVVIDTDGNITSSYNISTDVIQFENKELCDKYWSEYMGTDYIRTDK